APSRRRIGHADALSPGARRAVGVARARRRVVRDVPATGRGGLHPLVERAALAPRRVRPRAGARWVRPLGARGTGGGGRRGWAARDAVPRRRCRAAGRERLLRALAWRDARLPDRATAA